MLVKIRNFLSGKIGPTKAPSSLVVLLIDMQDRFFNLLEQDTRDELVAQQIRVIRTCAQQDIPLVVIEYQGFGTTIESLACEITQVPRTLTITKKGSDGFIGTKLHKALRRLGAKKLALMGMNASCCVRDTAESAVSRKYEILTADDVIAYEAGGKGRKKSRQWYEANGLFLKSLII